MAEQGHWYTEYAGLDYMYTENAPSMSQPVAAAPPPRTIIEPNIERPALELVCLKKKKLGKLIWGPSSQCCVQVQFVNAALVTHLELFHPTCGHLWTEAMILVGNSHRHYLRRAWKVYGQAYETFPDRALSLVTQVSLYMILLRMTLPRSWRAGCSRIW